MKAVQCPKGHYYDGDSYQSCPHCGDNNHMTVYSPPVDATHAHYLKEDNKKNGVKKPPQNIVQANEPVQKIQPVQPPVQKPVQPVNPVVPQPPIKPVTPVQPKPVQPAEPVQKKAKNTDFNGFLQKDGGFFKQDGAFLGFDVISDDAVNDAGNTKVRTDKKEPSLAEAVDLANNSENNDPKTQGFFSDDGENGNVVGWLVAVVGSYKGKSFEIKAGRNNIGRAVNMDISLVNEPTVSRNKHCILTFDPLSNTFFLSAGESSGLTYVNDVILIEHTKLNDFDKIKIGNAVFVFRSFCCESFGWDE